MKTPILIVEDEPLLSKGLERLLKKLDYPIIGRVRTGEDALNTVRNARPGLVMMDIHLAGDLDGIQTADLISARYRVPIVYLTAHSDEATLQRARQTGPFGYLLKPIDETALRVTLEMAVYKFEMEEKLRLSEAKHEAILQALPDMMFSLDRERRLLTYHCPAFQDLYLPPQNFLGKRVDDVMPSDFSQRYAAASRALFDDGTPQVFEYRLAMPQGGEQEFEARLVLNGEAQVLGIVRNITDRKQAERQLIKAKQEWESTFDAVPDLILILDTQFRIVRINRAMAERLRMTPQECTGKFCYTLAHNCQAPPFFCPNARMLRDGFEHSEEVREERLGGDFLVTASPLFDPEGRLIGSVHMARDITDRKRMENELRRMNDEAEAARQAAETANKAKSDFLANMSHELRTPLNGILGYAQILRRDARLSEQQRAAVQTIHRSGEHLLTLINDVLDISKIESGKIELQTASMNLRDMLRNIVDIMRVPACQKNLDLVYEEPPTLPMVVKGDEKRLRQVILNLLSNAIKFTEQGRVELTIEPQAAPAAAVMCQFSIRDTGVGIDADDLDDIFLPFRQVESSYLKHEGTGLGLSISRRIVEMMGGTLQVASTPGQGSRFWFAIPLTVLEEPSARPAGDSPREGPSCTVVGYAGPRKTLLLVDDEADNRRLLQEFLLKLDFHVVEASNGREALDKAVEARPDLVLMDVVMPVLDGLEATRQLRRLPQCRETCVVAVSANAFASTRDDCRAAGCCDFVPKPVDFDVLLTCLQRHLGLTWTTRRLSEAPADSGEMAIPPAEVLETLAGAADIGDISAITQELASVEAEDAAFAPFAAQVRQLTATFQLTPLRRMFKEYLEADSSCGESAPG